MDKVFKLKEFAAISESKDKETYDSTNDTMEHIKDVKDNIEQFNKKMHKRGEVHDKSKLESPEKEGFDKYTPILKSLKYGTKEYNDSLKNLEETLDHHYKNNSHHPQFYKEGINGMDLLDIVEMLMDWMAATKRNKDGDIKKSLEINKDRFKIDKQLYDILKNTIDRWNK